MSKIYDCFTFFNELDLLEIRLNELNDAVDKFVIVESALTHQGKPKPFYFEENKNRFKKFIDKIIYIKVAVFPKNRSPWSLENHQRNMIMKGLKNCQPNDIIIVSDLDEIPNPTLIDKAKRAKRRVSVFLQKMFYYYLNCINVSNNSPKNQGYVWCGSVMTEYRNLKKPQDLRNIAIGLMQIYDTRSVVERWFYFLYFYGKNFLQGRRIAAIKNGGWHFSYLGGVKKIIGKIESFAHSEFNRRKYKDVEAIKKAIKNGEDIFGRGYRYKFVKIDATFPGYIFNHQKELKKFIFDS